MFSAADHGHMAEALRLAELGRYTTKPNPCVGAVLVQGDTVVGRGFHQRAGEPHAEVFALREAGTRAHGATIYVTLEPCAHTGRTPPCADALKTAGVARVVYAVADPNPLVSGKGVARLQAAGVVVQTGLMRDAAQAQIEGFLSRIERGRPFVRVKSATSLDGRIALRSGESKWITGQAARADVQHWRAASGAILTGVGTVLADDPSLTARVDAPCVAPARVVLDTKGRLPASAKLLSDDAPTWVLTAPEHVKSLQTRCPAATVWGIAHGPDGRLSLTGALAWLAGQGINDLMVEAGGTLAGALLREGLIDEWLLYQNTCLLGDSGMPVFAGLSPSNMAAKPEWQCVDHRPIGSDWRWRLRPVTATGT
nr:bifunctional diaminohydroxyphosphoribosylaminopyrimidine deaminase/5-amino-6-(5-phosphoribosylamino)uracil reductase RibD [Ahniella affigens]